MLKYGHKKYINGGNHKIYDPDFKLPNLFVIEIRNTNSFNIYKIIV